MTRTTQEMRDKMLEHMPELRGWLRIKVDHIEGNIVTLSLWIANDEADLIYIGTRLVDEKGTLDIKDIENAFHISFL